ncbi:cytochrome P450 [Colletotrichum somersetense]|nr:cytochrome P450 [Colletotrichum somersetense]
MEIPALVSTVLAIVFGCYLFESYVFLNHDPREPAAIRPKVPLIGHLLGLMKSGPGYYFTKVEVQNKLKVFSLPIFNFKFYVFQDRKYFSAIQRNSRTLSFVPFVKKATYNIDGNGDKFAQLQDHIEGGPTAKEYEQVRRKTLAPGPDNDKMSLVAAQVQLEMVEKLLRDTAQSSAAQIDLFQWVRDTIIISTTEGIYGSSNPHRNPEHTADFLTYSSKAHILLGGGLLANFIGRKAVKARERNGQRYEEYFRHGRLEEASGFVRERSRVMAENGVPTRDTARSHLGFDIAALSNFVPTIWWAVYEIFSRPWLVEAIREEVSGAVSRQDGDSCGGFVLDLSVIRTSSPLLLSSFQEALRLYMAHAHIRKVLRDTTITLDDRKQLLKKGNYVQMNSIPVLHSEETWGADEASFDAYRFIKKKKNPEVPGVATAADLPSYAFAAWGVSPHICPARWFATAGAMTFIALMVLKLDIEAQPEAKGEGPTGRVWKMPQVRGTFVGLPAPSEPVPVVVRPRKGFEGRWTVETGTPCTRVQLSVP